MDVMSGDAEPPDEGTASARFVVGQDEDGQWVVGDRLGLCGGWFVNQEDAIRYARFESNGDAEPVAVSGGLMRIDETLARKARKRTTRAGGNPAIERPGD
jgi:hypothetical protein